MNAIKTLFAATLLVSCLGISGCAADAPDTELVGQDAAASYASPEALVGRFRFVFEGQRKAAIMADLESKLSGDALAQAKREVEEEVASSVLEFRADGRFISWVGAEAVLDTSYQASVASDNVLDLKDGGGRATTVTFLDADTIVIADPKKGDLTFRRVGK